MSFAVRSASPITEREELIAVLERNFEYDFPVRAHYKWRHEDNPAGPGWSWVIYDRQSGAIGAVTSLFPRPMYLDGKLAMVGQVAQFAVDHAYRSLGPAMMLQRATFEPVDSGTLAMCYDCPPHDHGMSTFVRLGLRPTCQVDRYVLMLRSDEIVEKTVGKNFWAKPLIAGANLLLKLQQRKRRIPGLEIHRLDGRFDEEFTHLDKIVPSSGIIRCSRSAELLNWRYRDSFDSNNEVLVAREGGELVAFLALNIYELHDQKRACISDLFGRKLNQTGLALIDAAIEMCHQRNIVCLEGHCSETSELMQLFEAFRFRPRELTARVVPYVKSGRQDASLCWPLAQAEVLA